MGLRSPIHVACITGITVGALLGSQCTTDDTAEPGADGAAGKAGATAEVADAGAGPAPSAGAGHAGSASNVERSADAGRSGRSGRAGRAAGAAAGGAGGAGGSQAAAGSGGDPSTALGTSGVGVATENNGVLSASIVMNQVAAGEEAHRCVVVALPNAAPVWVGTLHASLSNGSHHLIVDRRPSAAELIGTAEECSPTMAGDDTRLLIAQQHETQLALPSGVAYRLEARQRIFLQLHYINTTDKPETITGKVELNVMPDGAMPAEAKSIFAGATDISLAPQQAGLASYFAQPVAAGATARHVFALTSHTHQLGIRSIIERVASRDAPESTPIHESLNWSEPPLTVFDKPLDFTGSDGLRLTCNYMNTTTRTVHFGTATTDEMCFMWLYYYEN